MGSKAAAFWLLAAHPDGSSLVPAPRRCRHPGVMVSKTLPFLGLDLGLHTMAAPHFIFTTMHHRNTQALVRQRPNGLRFSSLNCTEMYHPDHLLPVKTNSSIAPYKHTSRHQPPSPVNSVFTVVTLAAKIVASPSFSIF